jgi:hypothetical protein
MLSYKNISEYMDSDGQQDNLQFAVCGNVLILNKYFYGFSGKVCTYVWYKTTINMV